MLTAMILMAMAPPQNDAALTAFLPDEVPLYAEDGKTVKAVKAKAELQQEVRRKSGHIPLGPSGRRNTVQISMFNDVYYVRVADIVFDGKLKDAGGCRPLPIPTGGPANRLHTVGDVGVSAGASGASLPC